MPTAVATTPAGLLPDRPTTVPTAAAIAAAVKAATGGGANVTSTLAAGTADASPAAGFAAALAAQQLGPTVDPRTLPSVSLDQMVRAVAGSPLTPPAPVTALPDAASATGPSGLLEVTPGAGTGRGAEVLAAGERYLGVPYRWGGTSARTGFDCSGFVQQVYSDLGVSLPRVSVDQAKSGAAVPGIDAARPGDLVFWKATGGRPNHIGIYAGDGKMLVAPRTGDVVRYQDIRRTPDAIRRVIT